MCPQDTCNWTIEVAPSQGVCVVTLYIFVSGIPSSLSYYLSDLGNLWASLILIFHVPLLMLESILICQLGTILPLSRVYGVQVSLLAECLTLWEICDTPLSSTYEEKKKNHPLDFRRVVCIQFVLCSQVICIALSLVVFIIISTTHPFSTEKISGSILCSHLIFKKCDVDSRAEVNNDVGNTSGNQQPQSNQGWYYILGSDLLYAVFINMFLGKGTKTSITNFTEIIHLWGVVNGRWE